MKDKKRLSGLGDYKRVKGILVAPLNAALGDRLKLNSWAKERMPEYLWLGLILIKYGRDGGFERARRILLEISETVKSLRHPRLSMIFSLAADEEKEVYKTICRHIDKETLSPLTILYKSAQYPNFNEFFFVPHLTVEERIDALSEAIDLYLPHQSNEATDLRFLSLSLLLFSGKMHFVRGTEMTINAIQEYAYTNHASEKMKFYRPLIRSTEGGMTMEEYDKQFSLNFWRNIGMLISCSPTKIEYQENLNNYNEFVGDCRKALEYVLYSNKDKSITDDRFAVIIGSVNYALKIFSEIDAKALGNSILGRHGIRSIIEVYIMLKYLLKKEDEKPEIWREYKLYGISKYQLILLKARGYEFSDKTSHFQPPVTDLLVNEFMAEELINVDLRYFDNQTIREKSEVAGEKQLYDLFYDYDTNFSHGLWGAIREGAMIRCDNASHHFHAIPDIYANQTLPDVKLDSLKILKMVFRLFSELYETPSWFVDKHELRK